jgi:hypothetical protein
MSERKTLSLSQSKKMRRRFYANAKNFKPDQQPASFEELPPVFLEAKELWEKGKERNLPEVTALLNPYLRASFVLEQLPGAEQLFANPEHLPRSPEFKATALKLVGVNFSEGPLPSCKLEAEFELPITLKFKEMDLRKWQHQHGLLSKALCFYWEVPVAGELRQFKGSNCEEYDCGTALTDV